MFLSILTTLIYKICVYNHLLSTHRGIQLITSVHTDKNLVTIPKTMWRTVLVVLLGVLLSQLVSGMPRPVAEPTPSGRADPAIQAFYAPAGPAPGANYEEELFLRMGI